MTGLPSCGCRVSNAIHGLAAAALLVSSMALGAEQPVSVSTFITLGTQGGPVPNAKRSQPANLLLVDGEPIVVDAGDGVAERLAAAAIPVAAVRTVFLPARSAS